MHQPWAVDLQLALGGLVATLTGTEWLSIRREVWGGRTVVVLRTSDFKHANCICIWRYQTKCSLFPLEWKKKSHQLRVKLREIIGSRNWVFMSDQNWKIVSESFSQPHIDNDQFQSAFPTQIFQKMNTRSLRENPFNFKTKNAQWFSQKHYHHHYLSCDFKVPKPFPLFLWFVVIHTGQHLSS